MIEDDLHVGLEQTIKETFTLEDLRRLEDRLECAANQRPIYQQKGIWVQKQDEAAGKANRNQSTFTNTASFGRSSFGDKVKYDKYLRTFNEEEMHNRCLCRVCGDMVENPQIINCKHVFCRDCIVSECEKAAAAGIGYPNRPVCYQKYSEVLPYIDLKTHPFTDLDAPEEADDESSSQNRHGKTNQKEKRASKSWLDMSDGDAIPPSSKLVAAKVIPQN